MAPPDLSTARPAPDDPAAPEGTPFGRYCLLDELGRGGMGVVWKAWDTRLRRVVALKQILSRGERDRQVVERFLREARLAAKLTHPNIVQVHDVGEHDGQHYLTCDFVEGRPLSELVASPVDPVQAATWMKKVASGLAHAHAHGVIHRDIKPQNILIDAAGEPRILDFGLAKEVDAASTRALTKSGDLLGTPAYMSPEQAGGGPEGVGPASDQFSLGTVLYQLLTGRLPFGGLLLRDLLNQIAEKDPEPPTRIQPGLHRDLESICLKAMEKDPARRYASLQDLAADLGRYLGGGTILARRIGPFRRMLRAAARNRRVVVPVAVLALVAIAALILVAVNRIERERKVDTLLTAARAEVANAAALADEGRVAALGRAQEAYGAAYSLAPERAEARDGVRRMKEAIEEAAQQRARTEAETLQMIEAGRPSIEEAVEYLYSQDANYEELARRLEKGKAWLEQGVAKAPRLAIGQYLLGRVWRLLGDAERAEACWIEAIRRDPNLAPAHFHLGLLKLEQGISAASFGSEMETSERREARTEALLKEARERLEAAARLPVAAGDEVSGELLAAALAHVTHDKPRVQEVCVAAIERLGGKAGSEWFMYILGHQGDEREHEARTEQILAIFPRHCMALLCRATTRKNCGDLEGALADLNHALAIQPRSTTALTCRGSVLEARGDLEGAIADDSRAIEIDPDMTMAYVNRGLIRYHQGEDDSAMADFDRVIALDPSLPHAWANRAFVRIEKGDLEGALSDHRRALEVAASDWEHRAEVEHSIALIEESLRVRSWEPTIASAEEALSRGDYPTARHLLEHLLALSEAQPFVDEQFMREGASGLHYNLASVYSVIGSGRESPNGDAKAIPPEEAARLHDRAFEHLSRAIDMGYAEREPYLSNPDFVPLHGDSRWSRILARLAK